MQDMKEKIKNRMKKEVAISELKKGMGVKRAAEVSGLLEVDVVELNRQLLEQARKGKEKEEKIK